MLTDSQRAQFEQRLQAAFEQTSAGFADEIMAALGEPPDADRVPQSLWDRLNAALNAALEPILLEMALASAAGLAVTVGFDPGIVNERAAAWAEQYSFDLVKGITDNSAARLGELVGAFFRDPAQDLQGLADKIAALFGPVRGEMIATTEATRASAEGEQRLLEEIMQLNPSARMEEFWQTSEDEIVCPICRPLNGVKGDGKGNFKHPDDGKRYRLPAHPRCRCARRARIVGLND